MCKVIVPPHSLQTQGEIQYTFTMCHPATEGEGGGGLHNSARTGYKRYWAAEDAREKLTAER